MRLRLLLPVLLVVGVATGAAIAARAAADRQRTFAASAAALRAEWDRDAGAGVPAASLDTLRAQLSTQAPTAAWWSPAWLGDDGHQVIDTLTARTRSAWEAALAGQRAEAQSVIAQWTAYASQQAAWLTADATAAAAAWPGQLEAASSPASIAALAASWRTFLAREQAAVAGAQQVQLTDELRAAGGSQAVLATARRLLADAAGANLDPGQVPGLAAQLASDISAGHSTDAVAAGGQLLTALASLQSLVTLNDQVDAQVLPLRWSLDQAEAEGTPHAGALAAQDGAVAAQFRAARTAAQVSAAAQAIAALTSQVDAELTASQCGHRVGSGKVITISLSFQEMVFYQDGCVAKATPVSTGRPQLRTPTGTFSIFYKKTPFTFISPWPPSSPFYYYPSPVSWVMEFAAGGYFIHDAPWESPGSYGPGSEDNLSAASHGCVHTPTAVMQWAFSWTPVGTPVVISA